MKSVALLLCCTALAHTAGAAPLELATLSCEKYEGEVLPAAASNPIADAINTVMWLLGYSVAKAGGHAMSPDALGPFGFGLDNECKSNPSEPLLAALSIVKPETRRPMDLSEVPCSAFLRRHRGMMQTDTDSATTIMMWLFGYSEAKSGGTLFDADLLKAFENALLEECTKHPDTGLLDALKGLHWSTPRPKPPKAQPAAR